METVQLIALSMGAAWASGINLYAAIFMLGYLANTGNIVLPEQLMVVADPLVMMAAAIMYCVEFFADKVPGVDTAWDSIHTFIRIPAGAILAMAAVGDTTPALEFAAFLLGGTIATGTHLTKASSRVLINTSPEPVTNWTASFVEDFAVIAGLWTALNHPVLFLVLLVVFIAFVIWFLPKLLRAIKKVFNYIRKMIQGEKENYEPNDQANNPIEKLP